MHDIFLQINWSVRYNIKMEWSDCCNHLSTNGGTADPRLIQCSKSACHPGVLWTCAVCWSLTHSDFASVPWGLSEYRRLPVTTRPSIHYHDAKNPEDVCFLSATTTARKHWEINARIPDKMTGLPRRITKVSVSPCRIRMWALFWFFFSSSSPSLPLPLPLSLLAVAEALNAQRQVAALCCYARLAAAPANGGIHLIKSTLVK